MYQQVANATNQHLEQRFHFIRELRTARNFQDHLSQVLSFWKKRKTLISGGEAKDMLGGTYIVPPSRAEQKESGNHKHAVKHI